MGIITNIFRRKSKPFIHDVSVPFAESSLEKMFGEYNAVRTSLRDTIGCAQPQHDPYKLLALKSASGYHSYALHTKSVLSAGLGYECSDKLLPHIKQANPDESFQKVLNFWSKNIETFGNGYLKVIRGAKTVNFYAMPSLRTRIKPNADGSGIENVVEYNYALGTGIMAYVLHDVFDYGVQEGIDIFKLDSLSGNMWYGDPDYESIIKTLSINISLVDVMQKFFDNSMMTNMAIIMRGGDLDDEEKEKVKNYLTRNMRGVHNAFKVLFMEVGPEEHVDFHKLSADMDFRGFIALRKLFREEEAAGNHLQPRELGIVEAGSLGGTGEGETQLRKTKLTFSDPRQQLLEEHLQILFDKAGLPDPESFKLKRMDISAGTEVPVEPPKRIIIGRPNVGLDDAGDLDEEKSAEDFLRGLASTKKLFGYNGISRRII
jgi:hypothetical protein